MSFFYCFMLARVWPKIHARNSVRKCLFLFFSDVTQFYPEYLIDSNLLPPENHLICLANPAIFLKRFGLKTHYFRSDIVFFGPHRTNTSSSPPFSGYSANQTSAHNTTLFNIPFLITLAKIQLLSHCSETSNYSIFQFFPIRSPSHSLPSHACLRSGCDTACVSKSCVGPKLLESGK